jgi:hypothetical protein
MPSLQEGAGSSKSAKFVTANPLDPMIKPFDNNMVRTYVVRLEPYHPTHTHCGAVISGVQWCRPYTLLLLAIIIISLSHTRSLFIFS